MMKPDLELLSTIRPAEVSPFLFTRIEQRLKQVSTDKLSPLAAWSIAAAVAAVLVVNVALISTAGNSVQHEPSNAMLSSLNNLYNE